MNGREGQYDDRSFPNYGATAPSQAAIRKNFAATRNMPAASPSASSSKSYGSDTLSTTNLYIRGLNVNTTDKDLLALCSKYGKINSTKAIVDPSTNKCKGYGFVDFENPQAAEAAVKDLQSTGVQAQMAKVSKAQEQDPTNLYIANLPVVYTEQDLEKMFSPYGQVISTRILRDQSGTSRGVGFARMESKEKCEQIIQAFNSKIVANAQEPLNVKFADSGHKKRTKPTNIAHQWTDYRAQDIPGYPIGLPFPFDQHPQNGIPQVLTPPNMRYPPANLGYSQPLPASNPWMYPNMMPTHAAMAPVAGGSNIPTAASPGTGIDAHLYSQMNQLSLDARDPAVSTGAAHI